MTTSPDNKCRRKVYLVNMALGALVVIASIYMIITGEYSNLAERKDVESTLNIFSVFGLLYATGAWYGYIFFTPNCSNKPEVSE